MKLVVGLGNPGDKYKNTRHNIGFEVVDRLISATNAQKVSKKSFQGDLFKAKDTLFLKPNTFMNLSGKSVRATMQFYKIDLDSLIVIHDDLDLPLGSLKFKRGGSSGGHNGLKSIDELVGKEYLRVRVGIGRPKKKSEVVSFVLSPFREEEREIILKVIDYLEKIFDQILTLDLNQLKSRYTLKGVNASI
jgi:PTH1 family peptidyl-tRNA hydrolase